MKKPITDEEKGINTILKGAEGFLRDNRRDLFLIGWDLARILVVLAPEE